MPTLDPVRSSMRDENLPAMRCRVANPEVNKSELNPTKAIDREPEDLTAINGKFAKRPQVKAYTVLSEDMEIKTFPEGASQSDADWVVRIDPIRCEPYGSQ